MCNGSFIKILILFRHKGTDEETYWNKLKADKMKKYETKQKKSGKRGQKKVNEVNIQINKLHGLCVVSF